MDFKKIAKKRKARARKGWGWTLLALGIIILFNLGSPEYTTQEVFRDCAVLAVPGAFLLIWAYTDVRRWNKLEAYVNNVGNTWIPDIAAKLGKPEVWVAEQLQKMVSLGFFASPQGHDAIVNTVDGLFIMTKNGEPIEDVVEDLKEKYAKKEKEAAEKAQSATVKAIRQAIAVCEDENTVEILRDLEKAVKKVENTLIEKPDLEQDKMVVKMRSEYMPVILDLIKKLGSENFTDETKAQIKETLVTCTEAFRNLNKSLNENDNTMTQVDIDVIKSKLASEGYLDPDFDIK